jgi:hypothetical protein
LPGSETALHIELNAALRLDVRNVELEAGLGQSPMASAKEYGKRSLKADHGTIISRAHRMHAESG